MSEYFGNLLSHFEGLALDQTNESIDELVHVLSVRDSGTFENHIVPRLACLALIRKGEVGVNVMGKVLPSAPGHIYPMVILSALWHCSEGRRIPVTFLDVPNRSILAQDIPSNVQATARAQFFGFLEDCKTDPESFDRLISLLAHEQWASSSDQEDNSRFHRALFRTVAESAISVSPRIVEVYSSIISDQHREEEYQRFLEKNPVFLDPLASRLLPKHRLGDDFITDYILEKLTGDYVAVEIEKPSDPVFTQSDDFSHQFTHAFGQVIDFIEWVEDNVAYAQKKLQGISSPSGLLVIGMRADMSDHQQKKLSRFNKNSSRIQVRTFDDLLHSTETLLRNLQARVGFDA